MQVGSGDKWDVPHNQAFMLNSPLATARSGAKLPLTSFLILCTHFLIEYHFWFDVFRKFAWNGKGGGLEQATPLSTYRQTNLPGDGRVGGPGNGDPP